MPDVDAAEITKPCLELLNTYISCGSGLQTLITGPLLTGYCPGGRLFSTAVSVTW